MVSLHEGTFVLFFPSGPAFSFLLRPQPRRWVGWLVLHAARLQASSVTSVVGLHASWTVPTAPIQTLQRLKSAGD